MALFNSFASFNAAEAEYIKTDGTKVHPQMYTAFTTDYSAGSAQILGDFAYLGQKGVKMVRIWPVISQFYFYSGAWQSTPNANISNFDAVLAACASAGIQAYCTLLSTPQNGSTDQCVTNANMFMTPALVQNTAGAQDAFIAALSNFFTRYASNTTIVAYDVVNEIDQIVKGIISGSQLCSEVWDTSGLSFTQLKAFMARVVSTLKSVDYKHQMTFSCAGIQTMGNTAQTLLAPYVDFYDFHAYALDPTSLYANFSTQYGTFDKLIIQGEVGINQTVTDPGTGLSCDPDTWNVAPLMSSYCQTVWLTNAMQFYQGAKTAGIAHIFFSYWPTFRWFGIRTDNGSNQWLGHQLSSPGINAFNLAVANPVSIVSTDTFTRADQNGWNPASDGETWNQASGTATPTITGNNGQLVNVTGGTNIMLMGGHAGADIEPITVRFSVSGSTDIFGLLARFTASTNRYYHARISGTGLFQLQKFVNGITTNLAAVAFSTSINTFYWIRFVVVGSFIGASIWADGTAAPVSFMLAIHDTSIIEVGSYGLLYTPASVAGRTLKVNSFSANVQNPYPAALFPTPSRRSGLFLTPSRRSGLFPATNRRQS